MDILVFRHRHCTNPGMSRPHLRPLACRVRRACAVGSTALLTVLTLTGCAERDEAAEAGVERVMTVELAQAQSVDWVEQAYSVGVLRAEETVTLRNTVPAHVLSIPGNEGDIVKKGDPVVVLDDEIYRLEYERAASILRQRERDYERAGRLFADGNLAESEYLAAETQLATATAEQALARRRLNDTEIRAPMDGVLGRRYISPGEYAEALTPLFDLFKTDLLRLDFNLPKRYLGRVRPGQRVQLETRGLTGENFKGEVYFVDPALDPATRTIRVRALVDNKAGRLSPNLFVNLSLEVGVLRDSVVIPEDALITDLGGFSVYVVDDQYIARRRDLNIGNRMDGVILVREGLKAGEMIVETGHQRLFEEARVRDRRADD